MISAATLVELGIVPEVRFGPVGMTVTDRFVADARIDVVPVDREQAGPRSSGVAEIRTQATPRRPQLWGLLYLCARRCGVGSHSLHRRRLLVHRPRRNRRLTSDSAMSGSGLERPHVVESLPNPLPADSVGALPPSVRVRRGVLSLL